MLELIVNLVHDLLLLKLPERLQVIKGFYSVFNLVHRWSLSPTVGFPPIIPLIVSQLFHYSLPQRRQPLARAGLQPVEAVEHPRHVAQAHGEGERKVGESLRHNGGLHLQR
jgi:hypothetical protein